MRRGERRRVTTSRRPVKDAITAAAKGEQGSRSACCMKQGDALSRDDARQMERCGLRYPTSRASAGTGPSTGSTRCSRHGVERLTTCAKISTRPPLRRSLGMLQDMAFEKLRDSIARPDRAAALPRCSCWALIAALLPVLHADRSAVAAGRDGVVRHRRARSSSPSICTAVQRRDHADLMREQPRSATMPIACCCSAITSCW